MNAKTIILTVTVASLSLLTSTVYAQEANVSKAERIRKDSLTQVQIAQDESIIADHEDAKRETKAKAKEARRIEREANNAARESSNALKAERKAQKTRKQADRQAAKAAKAREKSDIN
jgi:hypothetical protein